MSLWRSNLPVAKGLPIPFLLATSCTRTGAMERWRLGAATTGPDSLVEKKLEPFTLWHVPCSMI
jgi:hypothetical protein